MADECRVVSDIGPKVATWLRSNYQDCTAKRVARDFRVSERQAQRWAAGERPTSEHLSAMAARWGWRFVDFVFEGAVGIAAAARPPSNVELYERLDRLEQSMSEIRSALREGKNDR